MQVTEVRIRKMFDDEKAMKAIASVTFDGCFVVHDIKVIEGKGGMFVAMPSRQNGEGRFMDITHPLDQKTRSMIVEAVLTEYKNVCN